MQNAGASDVREAQQEARIALEREEEEEELRMRIVEIGVEEQMLSRHSKSKSSLQALEHNHYVLEACSQSTSYSFS